jgi:antirestriction protein ArdC
MLEKGTVPWRKPWKVQTGLPRNLISGKPYRGINTFLLHAMNYESPFWLTYRQALELGGNVRKGEKACPVVFWKQLEIEDKESGELEKVVCKGKPNPVSLERRWGNSRNDGTCGKVTAL